MVRYFKNVVDKKKESIGNNLLKIWWTKEENYEQNNFLKIWWVEKESLILTNI